MSSNTPRLDLVERNLIINGNFDFWQRGTSVSVANANKYLADRWLTQTTSSYTVTVSQSTDTPTQAQSGWQSKYSMLVTNGTGASPAAGDYIVPQYRMEGQDYQSIHGRKCRLQFWVKSSIAGTYSLALQNTGSRSYVTTYTITTANTWQKVLLDMPLDSTGSWNFDNTIGLVVVFTLGGGTTFQTSSLNTWQSANVLAASTQTQWGATTGATFQLAQVMLIPQDYTQAGSTTVDVPFQRCGRSIGHELQMCQRYYYAPNWDDTADTYSPFCMGQATSSGSGIIFMQFPVPMRAVPTVDQGTSMYISGPSGTGSPSTVTSGPTIYSGGTQGFIGNITFSTGPTAGNAFIIYRSGAVGGKINMSAEL